MCAAFATLCFRYNTSTILHLSGLCITYMPKGNVVETRHQPSTHKTQKETGAEAKFSKQGTDQQSTIRRRNKVEREKMPKQGTDQQSTRRRRKKWKGKVVETMHRSVFYTVHKLYSAILSVIVFKKRHGKSQKAGAEIRTRNPRFGIIRREPEPLR